MTEPTALIVTASHTASYAKAIDASKGETLSVGPEDIDFPGWVWCTSVTGVSSWVPIAYLEIDGESGRLKRDYNAMELSVEVGQRLTRIDEESGWYLCETESHQRGWVPMENIRAL